MKPAGQISACNINIFDDQRMAQLPEILSCITLISIAWLPDQPMLHSIIKWAALFAPVTNSVHSIDYVAYQGKFVDAA